MQTVIPSDCNAFTGLDQRLMPAYYLLDDGEIGELSPVIIPSYFTPERRMRYAAWLRQHPLVTKMPAFDEPLSKSDLCKLVFRRYAQHHCLTSPVTQQGMPTAMLSLFRPRTQKPFESCEQALVLRLLPYLAHALQASEDQDIQYTENGSSGMMIMDVQGTVVYLSREADSLLALACQPILTMDARNQKAELLAKLAQLSRNLEALFRGQNVPSPSWHHTNGHGRFMFRAYWLDNQNHEPDGLIGMTVEHQEPLVLKVLRAMQNLPLSPTQKVVGLMLTQGVSSEKIGERLHIKPSTVKDHVGKIFTKLDIHRREELLPMLLALDSSIYVRKVW